MSSKFVALVRTQLAVEKIRISTQIRVSHLKRCNEKDPDTEEALRRLIDLESWVDGRVGQLLKDHPAYYWFHRIKGIGQENIAKVVGMVRVAPETKDDGTELPYADTVSALWRFAGMSVEDGKAPKRKEGQTQIYNARLRTMVWRLSTSLLKAGLRKKCSICGEVLGETRIKTHKCKDAVFNEAAISKFGGYYLDQKARYYDRYKREGIAVVPTSALPKKDGKYYEPPGMISEGHVHNQAQRKMAKMFLALLYVAWREGIGLEVRSPYVQEYLGHTHIYKPADFIDRGSKLVKPKSSKRSG